MLLSGCLSGAPSCIQGADAVAMVETVEHLDPPALDAIGPVVLGAIRPRTFVVTTPNREYNQVQGPSLST
eukprot:5342323-Pyramimonas_sp.AAC.1